jgi:hypothetical protein
LQLSADQGFAVPQYDHGLCLCLGDGLPMNQSSTKRRAFSNENLQKRENEFRIV